jgi:hypothetical protein
MRLTLFSKFYLVLASVFIIIGLQKNFELLYVAFATLIIALCSSLPWWQRTNLAHSKINLVFSWFCIIILVLIQCYGLISRHFGFSSFIIGSLILLFVGIAEIIYIVKDSSEKTQ